MLKKKHIVLCLWPFSIHCLILDKSDSSETDSSEMHGSSSKRRKVRRSIGSSIKRSASVLARTFRDCEEKKEKRHQEAMEIEQRRLQIEEKQNEVNHQGMANLVAAMTNLSGAIQSLISASHDHQWHDTFMLKLFPSLSHSFFKLIIGVFKIRLS